MSGSEPSCQTPGWKKACGRQSCKLYGPTTILVLDPLQFSVVTPAINNTETEKALLYIRHSVEVKRFGSFQDITICYSFKKVFVVSNWCEVTYFWASTIVMKFGWQLKRTTQSNTKQQLEVVHIAPSRNTSLKQRCYWFVQVLNAVIHICVCLLDAQIQQKQRSPQQPVPIVNSSSRSVNFCVMAAKTISPTALQL